MNEVGNLMYLDSSILIKLLTDEPDTAFFQEATVGQFLSSSELAATEVFSALLYKEREKLISEKQRVAAWRFFNKLIENREVILHPLDHVVLAKARQILETCHPKVPLQTLDAIHTASCDLSQDFPLCTADRRMRDAAMQMHIPTFPAAQTPTRY